MGSTSDEEPASHWFCTVLPAIARRHPDKVRLAMQEPHQAVLVPPGWWHAVWNCAVGPTVAVTENSVSWRTFEAEWTQLWQQWLCGEVTEQTSCSPRSDTSTEGLSRLLQQVCQCFGLVGEQQTQRWLSRLVAFRRNQQQGQEGPPQPLPPGLEACAAVGKDSVAGA